MNNAQHTKALRQLDGRLLAYVMAMGHNAGKSKAQVLQQMADNARALRISGACNFK